MKFWIKSKKVDIYEILCNFEVLAQRLNKLDIVDKATTSDLKLNPRDEFNTQLKDVMLEYIRSCKRADDSLTPIESDTLVSLSKDKSIVITKADKGDAVVLQNRNDYENKMLK